MDTVLNQSSSDLQDDLTDFLNWFLEHMPIIGMVPFKNPIWKIEEVTSVLLCRVPPFQVQMFIVPEGTIIPEHTHPNVDSYEVYVGGNIQFSHKGVYVTPKEEIKEDPEHKTATCRGGRIRVLPNDKHGGTFGAGGGVFLSVQKWLNGVEPHCVAADYIGVTMGKDHFDKVIYGVPEFKKKLTELDVINHP